MGQHQADRNISRMAGAIQSGLSRLHTLKGARSPLADEAGMQLPVGSTSCIFGDRMPICVDRLKLIANLCVIRMGLKVFKSRHKKLTGGVTVCRECNRNLSIAGANKVRGSK
jgi:hypothetical protein